MCGIVAGVSVKNIVPILIQGLQRLEYRGYDSCGVAIYAATPSSTGKVQRLRSTARVKELAAQAKDIQSTTGVAHTRWATHGAPVVDNAHPHFSFGPRQNGATTAKIAVVHNGIIENHEELRRDLINKGYQFSSQTDTEVIAHLLDEAYDGDLFAAVKRIQPLLKGAYALAAFSEFEPQRIVGARLGSPLVLGIGEKEYFLASDPLALTGEVPQVVYLEEGDVVDLTVDGYQIVSSRNGVDFAPVERVVKPMYSFSTEVELGGYSHYMQKEIFEQPRAISDTLEGVEGFASSLFGAAAAGIFKQIDSILILACGTSYYSGCTAKYWLEAVAGIPTQVEIASEYRYRSSIPNPNSLVITVSQSGETADTLSALRHTQSLGMAHTLSICNVASSSMVRETALSYITRAGVEIGVASTKAFTTQLTAFYLLTLTLAKLRGKLSEQQEYEQLKALRHLPVALQAVLALEPQLIVWAEHFANKDNAIFLGRGSHYPIAMEGALKLKEISYIHAEGYPAGELKHGPLALITEQMPIVVVAPNDELLDKLKSNMQEVKARGGALYVLADADCKIVSEPGIHAIQMPEHYGVLSPILHTVALQLLAYHTACVKGTDVDKPRNLAKSVTVE